MLDCTGGDWWIERTDIVQGIYRTQRRQQNGKLGLAVTTVLVSAVCYGADLNLAFVLL